MGNTCTYWCTHVLLQNSLLTLDRNNNYFGFFIQNFFRFDLIVTAYDLGPTSLSSTATLTITINDINDNTPIFSQPVYYDNDIYENSTSVSITVSATDRDIGTNEDITYNIASGNQNNTFVIGE